MEKMIAMVHAARKMPISINDAVFLSNSSATTTQQRIVTIEATTRYFPPMALASYQMRESDRVFFVRKPYKTLGGIFRKIRGIEMAMLTTASSGATYSTPPGVFDKA
jgi:hypothetical protein